VAVRAQAKEVNPAVTDDSTPNPHRRPDDRPVLPVQRYTRIAGALFLISLVAGGFGEFFVPSQLIVFGNATATANNIVGSALLFRMGFAGYLVEAVCDVTLTLILYMLLRPVRTDLAILAVLFRLMGTATFAFAELFYFAAALILGGAGYLKSFSPGQLDAVALLSINVYGLGSGIFTVFYGVASILFGYLMYRSGYLPKVLGALLALGGCGFVVRNFALVLTPAFAPALLLLPTVVAALALTVWLLVKGVDVSRWEARANVVERLHAE
jgi:uncharacterized protein DUF4386